MGLIYSSLSVQCNKAQFPSWILLTMMQRLVKTEGGHRASQENYDSFLSTSKLPAFLAVCVSYRATFSPPLYWRGLALSSYSQSRLRSHSLSLYTQH